MTIRPIFAWYDFWIGVFWDRQKRRLYVFPVPMLGLVFDFGAKPSTYKPGEWLPGQKAAQKD